jgi:dTDP-4-dehydrorhamnose reductase
MTYLKKSLMRKLLVTGLTGQVGQAIKVKVDHDIWDVLITGHDVLDITNAAQISTVFLQFKPDVVINTAAYTDVDKAEKNQKTAQSVNAQGPYLLAQQCKKMAALFIHLSTDYIFDGQSERAYVEGDLACPINVYGLTKWQGELYIRASLIKYIIVRTSWVFSEHPNNFVSTILGLIGESAEINVVNDQIGCPTYAGDIADLVLAIAEDYINGRGHYQFGEYHYCGHENVSWFEFAGLILEEYKKYNNPSSSHKIKGISTEDSLLLANRPKYSVLNCSKIAHLVNPCDWRRGLYLVIEKLYQNSSMRTM